MSQDRSSGSVSPPEALPRRPRIKPIFDAMYLKGRIRVGSGPRYARQIDDPDGRYAHLIRLLDGTRTIDELEAQLRGVLVGEDVRDSVRALADEGIVEDAEAGPPPGLSADEVARYTANLNFFRTLNDESRTAYDYQIRLKQTRVLLLGLGGIGSNVCVALAELGVGQVTAVDFDQVELSNLNRQVLYSTSAAGRPKADVATERVAQFNPDISFEAVGQRISGRSDVDALLARVQPDFVFCLADKPNGWIDFWVNDACVAYGVPVAAANIMSATGTAYTTVPGRTACFQCRVDADVVGNPDLAEELAYVREHELNVSNGALGPACMFLGYYLSYEFLRHRLELGPMLTNDTLFEIDFMDFSQRYHPFPRRADCNSCGLARDTVAVRAAVDQG
jgi:molybdopterin/thiamine biosynthesis adenylyltransferase